MSESNYLTPEEQLEEFGNDIVANIIDNDANSVANKVYLFNNLSSSVFRNENYVIVSVLESFRDRLPKLEAKFLQLYLMRNRKLIQDNNGLIDISVYADLDEDPIIGYITGVLKHFDNLQTRERYAPDDFRVLIENYRSEYSNIELNNAFTVSKSILYDGVKLGHKQYQGYSDSIAYVKKAMADIELVQNRTAGEGFLDSRTEALRPNNMAQPELLGDFDLITELNDKLGGYYTGNFYNIMAPTKGGKSKFTTRAMHSIILNGNNISVWAHEGGPQAWWAQLRAIHYEYTYIRNKPPQDRPVPLSQKQILYKDYPTDAIRQLEEASAQDLFTNEAYGNIHMIDRPFLLETFIDEIDTSVQINSSKAVLIDYLQLIGAEGRNMSKPQIIGRAYQEFLSYCKKRNVMGISPSQFTQEFMKEMSNSTSGTSHEVRTAGGESAEIVRTPDINIALYASTQDIMNHKMTIMSIPSRLSEPFPDIPIICDLCSCIFSSLYTP